MEVNPEVGWYVYGFLPCSGQTLPPIRGIDGQSPVLLIAEGEIGAAVSQVRLAEFGEEPLKRNLDDVRWLEEKVRRHEEIVEAIMAEGPVLPAKLCTIFLGDGRVRGIIRRESRRLQEGLAYVRGKEEWGLKGFSNRARLCAAIARKDPELRTLAQEIRSRPPGHAFFLKKTYEDLVLRKTLEREEALAQQIVEAVRGKVVELVLNPPLPKPATGREEEMVLNLACLVLKERVGEFLSEVKRWNRRTPEEGLEIIPTGPWPPYTFAPRVDGNEQ